MKPWQKISLLVLNFFPLIAFAAPKNVSEILNLLTDIISRSLIPLLIAIALIVFIWGVINYITSAGDQEKRAESIQYMTWGIIGLFVIVAVWGLVGVLARTFGITIGIPQLLEK